MSLKKIYILVIFLTAATIQIIAKEKDSTNNRLGIGIIVGTDIGGAIPYPLSNIPSSFNAYPQIKLGIGGKVTFSLTHRWSLATDITYKSFGMKADAKVDNQKFNMDGAEMYFTGSAKMNMDFTILEIPIYARYHFKNGKDKIVAGLYYGYTFSSSFSVDPKKGFVGAEPNTVEITDMSNIEMDFGPDLDSWDMGFLLGYERKIIDRFNIGIRFSMGLKDIFKSSSQYFEYNMLPMRGTISLSYDLIKTKPLFKNK